MYKLKINNRRMQYMKNISLRRPIARDRTNHIKIKFLLRAANRYQNTWLDAIVYINQMPRNVAQLGINPFYIRKILIMTENVISS